MRRTVTRATAGLLVFGVLAAPQAARAQAEDVTFESSSSGVTLAGTLAVPAGDARAAAVLVSVAGPTDRDLTLGAHKYFGKLAAGLAESGIATLRYDDRGVGGSTGSILETDLETRAADACRAVEQLRDRLPGLDVGVIGMSEGGGIALLTTQMCAPIGFAVLLSAPVRPGTDVMTAQMRRMLVSPMIPEAQRPAVERESLRFLDLVSAPDPESNREEILALLSGPYGMAVLPPYGFVPTSPEGRTDFVLSPWYQSQVGYDVQRAARAAAVPVLGIYGDLDQAIDPGANVEALGELMPDADIVMLEGLNHLMQAAQTGFPLEYATLPDSMDDGVIHRVAEWLSGLP